MSQSTLPSETAAAVSVCRGAQASQCPHALDAAGLPEHLARLVEASGLPEFIQDRLGRAPKKHEQLRLAVAACANGCSRPHVADMAFIQACSPGLDPDACDGCGACEARCPDGAIAMQDGLPRIRRNACLDCGQCVLACPAGAMHCRAEGFRVLVGGRLGRRPRLGRELPGLRTAEGCEALARRALGLLRERWRPGLRHADILWGEHWPRAGEEAS
jgi:dissimilatory sulfite reductase (desulfoviridin) alpha/beta subunit